MNGTSSVKNSGHRKFKSRESQSTTFRAELRDDAYDLDRNGRWEKVYYEGRYRRLWRPTRVAPGWQPFTSGRWTVWYGDNVWIPEEPFGYVTHHYGNWVFVNSAWYWAPPVKVKLGYLGDANAGIPDESPGSIRGPMSDGSRLRPPRITTPITIGGVRAALPE